MRNFDLDDEDDEDEVRLEPELTVSLAYDRTKISRAFWRGDQTGIRIDVSEESETGPLRLELTPIRISMKSWKSARAHGPRRGGGMGGMG